MRACNQMIHALVQARGMTTTRSLTARSPSRRRQRRRCRSAPSARSNRPGPTAAGCRRSFGGTCRLREGRTRRTRPRSRAPWLDPRTPQEAPGRLPRAWPRAHRSRIRPCMRRGMPGAPPARRRRKSHGRTRRAQRLRRTPAHRGRRRRQRRSISSTKSCKFTFSSELIKPHRTGKPSCVIKEVAPA